MQDTLLEKSLQHGIPPQGSVQVYALSLWKCLVAPYLARSFDVEARTSAFLHTYAQLAQRLSVATVQALATEDHLLWQEGTHLITAKMEHVITNEGEVTLHYRVGSEPLYGMSFSLIPGRLVSLGVPTVLLLARMQGRMGPAAIAVRERGGGPRHLSPQAASYAALLGIARALDVPLVGVAATNQMCWTGERDAAFRRTYDDFYAVVGGRPFLHEFFWLPVKARRRPLAEIAILHRRRARQRREARDALSREAEASWHALARGELQSVGAS